MRGALAPFRAVSVAQHPAPPLPDWVRHQWGSWYVYGTGIDEWKIREQIDYIADYLNDVGPWHILFDAGWFVAEGRPGAELGRAIRKGAEAQALRPVPHAALFGFTRLVDARFHLTPKALNALARSVVEKYGKQALLDAINEPPSNGEPVDRKPKDPLGLTDREAEVIRLVAAGRSNQQIADELFITRKTASVHVSNILGKLGVTNRVEAAAVAQRLGLGSDGPGE